MKSGGLKRHRHKRSSFWSENMWRNQKGERECAQKQLCILLWKIYTNVHTFHVCLNAVRQDVRHMFNLMVLSWGWAWTSCVFWLDPLEVTQSYKLARVLCDLSIPISSEQIFRNETTYLPMFPCILWRYSALSVIMNICTNASTWMFHCFSQERGENSQPMKEEDLITLIDDVLRDDDKNNDGYIDYAEFAKSLE